MWLDPYTTQITIICMAIVLVIGMLLGSVITAAVDHIIENYTIEHMKKAQVLAYQKNQEMQGQVDKMMAYITEVVDSYSDAAGDGED